MADRFTSQIASALIAAALLVSPAVEARPRHPARSSATRVAATSIETDAAAAPGPAALGEALVDGGVEVSAGLAWAGEVFQKYGQMAWFQARGGAALEPAPGAALLAVAGGLLGLGSVEESLLGQAHVLVARPVAGELSSGFGARRDPINHHHSEHKGLDLRAPRYTPVHVAGAGLVVRAHVEHGYGRVIYVDHGVGLVTRYAHLQEIDVEVGQFVPAGQFIGKVGSSGRTTGPHLHFEVREGGEAVAPDRVQELPLFGESDSPLAQLGAELLPPPPVVTAQHQEPSRKSEPAHRAHKHRDHGPKHEHPEPRSRRPQS